MIRWFCCTAAALLIAAAPLRAEDADPPIDCAKASATSELNYCADQDLAQADKALNAAYEKVLAKVKQSAAGESYDAKTWEAKLRASQRAWIAFRDAECKELAPMSWSGGTGTTGAVLGCMSSITKQRTKDLDEQFGEQ